MSNTEQPKNELKMVKAMPSSPIYAIFDIVEVEGKQLIKGSIGFKDQFHMERMAQAAGERAVINLGQHILDIFAGKVDIAEPDDETKAKLLEVATEEAKSALSSGELQPQNQVDAPVENVVPFEPEALK